MPGPGPTTQSASDFNVLRAAIARFRPGGDSLVGLLNTRGINAFVVQSLASDSVEVMVRQPDLAGAQAIILEHRRARLGGLEVLARCPKCDYSLTGLPVPAICPECGCELEPARTALILADECQQSDEATPEETPAVRRRRGMYVMLSLILGVFALATLSASVAARDSFLLVTGLVLVSVAAFVGLRSHRRRRL